MTWAVIPVRGFADAKQRLRDCLTAEQRAALTRALLEDLLAVLTRSSVSGVGVVTADPAVRALARAGGVTVLADTGHGLSAAVTEAVVAWQQAGRDCLVLPGDLPLATPAAIEAVLARSEAGTVVLVPDRHRDGTNALWLGRGDRMTFHYGPGSFRRHWQAAEAAGLQPVACVEPALGLDLDTPADLRRLVAVLAGLPVQTHTEQLLQRWHWLSTAV